MFPYSVLYWIGLSISLCLICPVSVWLSNSLGNYSVLILLQVYFILMFSFLKFLPLSIYLWSMVWMHLSILLVPSQVLILIFSFRALFLTPFLSYRYHWSIPLAIRTHLPSPWHLSICHLYHCDSYATLVIRIYPSALQTL